MSFYPIFNADIIPVLLGEKNIFLYEKIVKSRSNPKNP